MAERADHRLEDQRDDRSRGGEAQKPDRTSAEVTCGIASGDEFLERGLCTREEAFAGFRQADAARSAYEERCANARLKCAYRLADRRGSHAEFRRRGKERQARDAAGGLVTFSERESEVLELLRNEFTTKQIAHRLGISPVTVRRHVSAILKKLQVADRSAALRLTGDAA